MRIPWKPCLGDWWPLFKIPFAFYIFLQVEDLTHYLEETGIKEKNKKHAQKISMRKQQEDKLKFEKLKCELESKMQLLDQPTTKSPSKGNVKMPKLVIIEYDGTYDKWLSFWNNALPVISRCQPNL